MANPVTDLQAPIARAAALFAGIQRGIADWAGDGSPLVTREIRPNSRMTAAARFAVYSRDYFGRMREVLQEDYGLVADLVGVEMWRRLADAFVLAFPSRHPNVNLYGAEFPAFLETGPLGQLLQAGTCAPLPSSLLADIARLERLVAESPMLDDAPPVSARDVAAVPPADWPRARLALRPTVRLVRLRWPVDAMLTAHGRGELVEVPGRESASTVQVWRNNQQTWRMEIPGARAALLSALMDGKTLAAGLDEASSALAAGGISEEEAASRVQSWFADWMAEGVFSAVVIDPSA